MPNRLTRLAAALAHKDPMEGFRLLRRFGRFIAPEYRFKWPHMAWWHNDDFSSFLSRFDEIDGLNTDRRWMLQQLVRLVDGIPGDTAECGAFNGAGSWLIARANDRSPFSRTHHAFDSFAGLSEPGDQDGDYWKGGDLSTTQTRFETNLADYQTHLAVHQGWIPDTFVNISPDQQFVFIHIDVDLYQPTKDSVTFFYPRMPAGAVLLCDDYGLTTCPGATRAMDEFLQDKPEKMIALSAGSGFFIKGTTTQVSVEPLRA